MGKGVAKVLADIDNHAHEIIILCRSKELGEAVVTELVNATSNMKISIILCDLTKLADVKSAIIEIHDKHEFLDGIFINAGLGYAAKRVETEDGFDSHFQVNYLSQFMLTLNLLDLLKKSEKGGRIIFNVTRMGEIFWDDMQMNKKWSFEDGIHQAMVAKRMFLAKLNNLHRDIEDSKLTFIGFEISKTVWSNQLNIIPLYMKLMATLMKLFGTFISIEKCGEIMTPLFTENQEESLKKSGKFITWKKNEFIDIKEDFAVLNQEYQDRLWKISLELCADEKTNQIATNLQN
jgi:hypothetical protein